MEIEAQNQNLAEISKSIFGDAATLQIVDPRSLVLLRKNARYFKKETFKQLVENIKQDRRLSSVPLCHILKDGRYEVLSGNHRVKAAIQAGIEFIMIIALQEKISGSEKIAVQLSHNALVGVDDPNILAELWSRIEDIKQKLYAGLSSDALNEIENIKLVTFSTPQVYTKSLTFAFTESERDNIEKVLAELGRTAAGTIYISPMSQFNEFFDLLQKTKKNANIKNGSLAMLKIIEIITQNMEDQK